jgi:hypothetical protein
MTENRPCDNAQHHQNPRAPAPSAAARSSGALGFAAPGSAEADAFDLAMADDLAAFDAELLAREGPDALTSDRALRLAHFREQQATERRQSVEAAECDHALAGYVLGAFRRQRGWSREQLADWLGISPDDYARLATLRRPLAVRGDLTYDREAVTVLADTVGAHSERLYEAFDRGDPY